MHMYMFNVSSTASRVMCACAVLHKGRARLRDLRGLPEGQVALAGLVEVPGLLHVLDELEQPRSTCRSTYNMSMPW